MAGCFLHTQKAQQSSGLHCDSASGLGKKYFYDDHSFLRLVHIWLKALWASTGLPLPGHFLLLPFPVAYVLMLLLSSAGLTDKASL